MRENTIKPFLLSLFIIFEISIAMELSSNAT
jgi:hypothetical protein